ncbi:MAG: hypothetical protein OXJ90_20710, partial [Spirochaetaceae bacterium]|nr:hypothetical protein [Spirochaetaceae bacterium]
MRCSAGATAPRPAASTSRCGAEVGNPRPPRTGARGALRRSASNRGPAAHVTVLDPAHARVPVVSEGSPRAAASRYAARKSR